MRLTAAQKLIIISTTLDMFLEGVFVTLPTLNALAVPPWATPLLLSTVPIGTLVGNLALGRLTDLRGRKWAYLAMLAVYAVGALLVLSSSWVPAVLAGLLITQAAMGGEVPIVLSYIVESAPVDVKERLVVLVTNVGNIGAVVVSALALAVGGLSAYAGRVAVGALIGLALAVMAFTRYMVPESGQWLSLRPEERGRVVLGSGGALWLALLSVMAVSSVLTFGLLALDIGPAEFRGIGIQLLVTYFTGEIVGGAVSAALIESVGSKSFTLASYLGGLVTSALALPAAHFGLEAFLALLFINGAFTEAVWASRNVLESLSFPTTYRGTGVAMVRVAPYVLLLASFFLLANVSVAAYMAFASAMWALGVAASGMWFIKGREVVGLPTPMRPEDVMKKVGDRSPTASANP